MKSVESVDKKILLTVFILAAFLSRGVLAADVKQMFLDDTTVSATRVINLAFDGVFDEKIYDVEYTVLTSNERFSSSYENRVYPRNDRLVRIYAPGSNSELAYFDDLLDPSFRLTEGTADQFLSALKGLMPEDFFKSVDTDPVKNKGNQWYFLTGEFFDHYKAFLVTVGPDGVIEGVDYQLKAIPTGSK